MSTLSQHLRKHLRGEVHDDKNTLRQFATDGSIFTVMPRAVVYPRDITDVRKLLRFSWQLAERGKKLPITCRGRGTDQSGAALSEGIVAVLPAHMNKLMDIDRDTVTVQPGMVYGDLLRTLASHDRMLPVYPASMEYSTVGGAVANNASGEKSVKYGTTLDFISELEVVLADGDVIRTRLLSKRDLNKKKGQSDFEGEIYRAIDGLLVDHADVIEEARLNVSKNTAGYNVWDVKHKDGSFNLTPLIAGSQGTLGIVSEITFRTIPQLQDTYLLNLGFDRLQDVEDALNVIHSMNPSAVEMVDEKLLRYLQEHAPEKLKGLYDDNSLPKVVLLVEFDDEKETTRRRKTKKLLKQLREITSFSELYTDIEDQERAWDIRRSVSDLMWRMHGKKRAVPVIDDAIVPMDKLTEFYENATRLLRQHQLEAALWGHAGDGHIKIQPLIDLDSVQGRQSITKLLKDYHQLVAEMGGSISAAHNDGRIRGPYIKDLYGEEMFKLFTEIKNIFDPHQSLNPGVKTGASEEDARKQMRREYSHALLRDYMPHVRH